MSIFKRLSTKDTVSKASEFDDETSDELPSREMDDVTNITAAIRSELEIEEDDDDIEDLAESSAQSAHFADESAAPLELSVEEILRENEENYPPDMSLDTYIDARGLQPVAREDIEDPEDFEVSGRPSGSSLEDIYESSEPFEQDKSDLRAETDMFDESPENETRPAAPRQPGMNLSELRLDIVRITSDIESGEALYRRAQQRVDSLVGFIEQAEVAVSRLSKIEPENRRLISENRSLETDVEAQRYKLAQLESDLESQRRLATDAHVKTETLRARLADLNEQAAERNTEIEALIAENDDLKIQKERIKTNLDIETRENITMRENLTELSGRAERLTDEKVDLQKTVETTSFDVRDMKDRLNTLEIENSELLLNLRNSERQNVLMKDELTEIQDKIVSFKTQHETHLHRRDDKIAALSARNAELEKIVKHKEGIIESTIEDVSDLRKTNTRHDIEREKLEQVISAQSFQLTKAEEELLSSKHRMSELDQRYKDVAEALAMKRIRQAPTRRSAPDIQPQTPQNRSTDQVSGRTGDPRNTNALNT